MRSLLLIIFLLPFYSYSENKYIETSFGLGSSGYMNSLDFSGGERGKNYNLFFSYNYIFPKNDNIFNVSLKYDYADIFDENYCDNYNFKLYNASVKLEYLYKFKNFGVKNLDLYIGVNCNACFNYGRINNSNSWNDLYFGFWNIGLGISQFTKYNIGKLELSNKIILPMFCYGFFPKYQHSFYDFNLSTYTKNLQFETIKNYLYLENVFTISYNEEKYWLNKFYLSYTFNNIWFDINNNTLKYRSNIFSLGFRHKF